MGLRRGNTGLTLLELVIVICIIGVVGAVLLDRLRFYQEAAEKAAMENTVGVLKSALQLRVAAMLLHGNEREVQSLARGNPVDWLAEPPRNYRGEFRAAQPQVPLGSWYFDATGRELVYVPDLDDHLKIGSTGSKALRFRVQLEYEPDPAAKRRVFTGMSIKPVTDYTWF